MKLREFYKLSLYGFLYGGSAYRVPVRVFETELRYHPELKYDPLIVNRDCKNILLKG